MSTTETSGFVIEKTPEGTPLPERKYDGSGFDIPNPPTEVEGQFVPPPVDDTEEIQSDQSSWFESFVMWGLLFIIALLLFGIGSQILHYYTVITALPYTLQWLFFICGGICTIIIIVVLAKITILWRTIKQNSIARLLNERKKWRTESSSANLQTQEKVKELLTQYLLEFDFSANMPKSKDKFGRKPNKSDRNTFIQLGMSDAEIDQLQKTKDELLNPLPHQVKSPGEWLKTFQSDFQSKLDELAKNRISAYYYKVLWGTAISPRAIVDQTIVLLACTSMVHDLLRIYRLKPAPGQTLFLLAHAFFNVYAAGSAQDKAETVANTVVDVLANGYKRLEDRSDILKTAGLSAIGEVPIIGKAIKSVTGKVAEGAFNAMLLLNLGRKSQQWIQPTPP